MSIRKPALAAWLLGVLLLTGCQTPSNPSAAAAGSMEFVQVAPDGERFELAPGHRAFHAWGFNYDRDYKMRLLEDYWETEWPTVVEDFQEMRRLGANVVRVHLQFAKFMESPAAPNQRALNRLGELLNVARKNRLYLDLTGLGCYRRADVPGWYSQLSETERWQAQAAFWEAVAKTCASSPAVFCYNLMNEPIVPSGKRKPGDWLTGELEGFTYVQFISLDQAGRPRADIAREWIATLAAAIRKHDPRHMITVGFLPNSLETPESLSGFPPDKVAAPLDYVSVHIYPKHSQLEEDLLNLRGFDIGKPLVVEETFPLACSSKELQEFIQRSSPPVAGWISFYWGRTPEELARDKDIASAMIRDWLQVFQQSKPK